ncbi:hypothetical protein BC835DRAFT_1262279 [Cytidiella melzeri]|nr:hypothetical protein BC835DRAFT_1262279 [Cytidiella melzeri]
MARPTTSKARGICKFYNTPTGCIAGRTCKFLHGDEELTPFDKAKTCKFYIAGFCKRGADCWFLHERPDRQQSATDEGSDDDTCGICYEKPTTYGLLAGCSHIFCVGCIKEWRDPRGKSEDIVSSGVTKRCPLCRAPSQFVTPSSLFFVQEQPQKRAVIDKYKASMAHVPCKYFEKSQKRFCPFGKDCFYQHLNNDGTPHTFKAGVNSLIRVSPTSFWHILSIPNSGIGSTVPGTSPTASHRWLFNLRT